MLLTEKILEEKETFFKALSIKGFKKAAYQFMADINASFSECLFIFDIDLTLTNPKNLAFQMKNVRRHQAVVEKIINKMSPLEIELMWSLAIIEGETTLIEEESRVFVTELQEKGALCLPFTARLTGTITNNITMQDFTGKELKGLGFNFEKGWDLSIHGYFDKVFTQHRGSHPGYFQGTLFSNGESGPYRKGDVLISFLQHLEKKPKGIIFIDDKIENLHSVKTSLERFHSDIVFLGVEYRGGDNIGDSVKLEEFEENLRLFVNKTTDLSRKKVDHPFLIRG